MKWIAPDKTNNYFAYDKEGLSGDYGTLAKVVVSSER
jgi:hypothetical protein